MNVVDNYTQAKKALLDHVGLIPDWVECPIEDHREHFWFVINEEGPYGKAKVIYGEKSILLRVLNGEEPEEDYYKDDIYTQCFYSKHVYRGKEFTLIFCDPHVDGVQWWRIFGTDQEIKEAPYNE